MENHHEPSTGIAVPSTPHHHGPEIPARHSSMPTTVPAQADDEGSIRSRRKKLKRSRSSLDETLQSFKETKRKYEAGEIPQVEWDTLQVGHLRTVSNLREAGSELHKEKSRLLNALSTNYDLSPEPSKDFASLLLGFFEKKEDRSSAEQSNFRKALIEAHDAMDDDENIYCPVLNDYSYHERVKAAHIYPYALGTTVMTMLFGDDSIGELFSVRNGLLLSDWFEKRFDLHQTVIVPAPGAKLLGNTGGIDRWIIHITDASICNIKVKDLKCTFGDLDGRELAFRNEARPAARYLYLHYLLSILRARKHGRQSQLVAETGTMEIPWNTLGRCMREKMLRALAAEVGHDVLAEHEIFKNGIPKGGDMPIPSSEENILAKRLLESGLSTGPGGEE
ncbi:hypothetical protein K440DRAFT_635269 [Wilcoxina mikolae CBS 423.85]|nr:hypothetical protein K440DRAFT_635269 [Wilcoxina mikolae CBS 423.85]